MTEDRGDSVAETRVRGSDQRVLSIEVRLKVDDVRSADEISGFIIVEVLGARQENRGHDFVAEVAGRVGEVRVSQFI